MSDVTGLTADLCFGDFTIVRSDERVMGPQGSLKLGRKAYRVLLGLAERNGRLLTKDELFGTVWDGTTVSESALTSVIKELRHALGDSSAEPIYIESVYGRGYRFLPSVTAVVDPASDRTFNAAPPAPAKAASPPKSVAVLPFVNLTGDPAKEYLADGMAEELITTLTRATCLKVSARTSAFSYKGRDTDVRDIARGLGVAYVLEGSVRAAGERLRVTAQLVDADSGFHRWSQVYDREMSDLIEVQDEIAENIAGTLQGKLCAKIPYRPNPQALELHMQARGMATRVTPESMLHSLALYEQSVARDPAFARAWSGLAGALMIAVALGVLPLDRRAEAREKAQAAIRLDPDYAEPHAILGALDAAAGRWLEAAAGFRTAIKMDPDEPTTREAMAWQLSSPCGHLRAGFELAKDAVRLAPACANHHLACAHFGHQTGDCEAQRSHMDAAILLGIPEQRGTVRTMRADVAFRDGRLDEAADFMASALTMPPPLREAGAAELTRSVYSALAGRGDRKAASEAVGCFVAILDRDDALWAYPAAPGYLIHWQVLLGSLDGAFEIADRLVGAWRRSGHLASFSLGHFWCEDMRPFRQDKRFQPLIEGLDLIPFWERHGPPDGHNLDDGQLVSL